MKGKKINGSLTIETALVLPVFLFMSITLISFIEIMNCYVEMEYALHETAREVAMLYYPYEKYNTEETSFELIAGGLLLEKIGLKKLNAMPLSNGVASINIFRSDIDNEYVDIVLTYKVSPMCNIFNVGNMTLINRAKIHSWTGYSNTKDGLEEEYVYITEYGSVYHTNRNCSHLYIKVNNVIFETVDNNRNREGNNYSPCEICCKGKYFEDCDIIYTTDSGTRYHSTLECSGIKRTVYKVKKTEVGNLPLCERCQKYIQIYEESNNGE